MTTPTPTGAQARDRSSASQGRPDEAGYALLLVLFLAAVVFITMATAAPSLLTEGRRQQEDETIWRGKQYARAVGLYFRKAGRFPTSVEDLTKGVNGLHFLRKAYKDPLNRKDGTWRFIYLAPNGQLIGSVRYFTLAQYQASQLPGAVQPVAPTKASNQGEGQSEATGEEATNAPTTPVTPNPTPPNTPNSASGARQPQSSLPTTSLAAQAITQGQASDNTSAFGTEDQVVGGNLIGVGSKAKGASIKVFMGANTYREWEFLWNPAAQAGPAVSVGVGPGGPARPGTNPTANPMPPLSNPVPPQ